MFSLDIWQFGIYIKVVDPYEFCNKNILCGEPSFGCNMQPTVTNCYKQALHKNIAKEYHNEDIHCISMKYLRWEVKEKYINSFTPWILNCSGAKTFWLVHQSLEKPCDKLLQVGAALRCTRISTKNFQKLN